MATPAEEEGHRGQQDHRKLCISGFPSFGEVSKVTECFVKVDFGFSFVYFVGVLCETVGEGTMLIIQIAMAGFGQPFVSFRETGSWNKNYDRVLGNSQNLRTLNSPLSCVQVLDYVYKNI